jgi:rhomboid protease GluP
MILILNVGLFMAMMLLVLRQGRDPMDLDGMTLYRFGAKYREAILAGEYWRLVTAGFLHGGVFHILMNSWVLFDLGALVEEVYGSSRLIVIYFFSTLTGFLASTLWSPGLSVGSSAGIFGLIGAMIALGMSSRSPLGDAIKGMYVRWAIYGLLMGLLPFFRIDNAAHLGGLAGGFLCARAAGTPRLFEDWREKIWEWASWAALALTALAFLRMFLLFRMLER